MVILGDYHTHTIYSSGKRNSKHATGTILENALIAKEKGLTEIAITDHGFSHKLYGLQRKNLQKMREEEERLKQERAAQQQQQQIDKLNSAFENLGSTISDAIQTANSYSIIFWNTHSSPRKITINGEIIGYVDGYSTKTFLVPIQLQGILQATQTKGYLFTPNVETFEIKGIRKRQTIKLKN